MTILQAISLLPPVMGAEITCQKLLPIVIHSSKEMAAEIICKKLLPVAINSSMDRCVTRDGGGVEVQGRGEQRGHKARAGGGCTGTLGGVEAVVRGARDGTTEEMLPLLGREAHDDTIDLVDGLLLQHERHKALNRGHGYDIMWRGAQGRHRVFPMAIEGGANDVLTHGGCGGRERRGRRRVARAAAVAMGRVAAGGEGDHGALEERCGGEAACERRGEKRCVTGSRPNA
jgi:hypothetical protein